MLLVPDLVIAFITEPLNFPYSASKLLVINRNSFRIQVRNQPRAKFSALADISSIHQEGIGGFSLAIYGKIPWRSYVSRNWPILLHGTRSDGHNSGLQAEKIYVAAAIERKRKHLL